MILYLFLGVGLCAIHPLESTCSPHLILKSGDYRGLFSVRVIFKTFVFSKTSEVCVYAPW
jgi:hypothetical protein